MKKTASIIVAIFLSLSFVISVFAETYHDDKYGITVTGPKGWLMTTGEMIRKANKEYYEEHGLKTLEEMSPGECFDTHLVTFDKHHNVQRIQYKNPEVITKVQCIEDKPDIMTSLDYAKYWVELLKNLKSTKVFFIDEPSEIVINGTEGAVLTYTLTPKIPSFATSAQKTKFLEKQIKVKVYIFLLPERRVLTLSAEASPDVFDSVWPEFEQAINSFKLEPKPK